MVAGGQAGVLAAREHRLRRDARGDQLGGRASRPNEIGGGKLCQLTDGRTFDQDPTWSPAGDQIAFKRGLRPAPTIQLMSADGKVAPRPIWTGSPGNQNAPAWTTR